MLKVVSINELENLFKNIASIGEEDVNLEEARNRILSKNIYAFQNLPGFNRSSVDGYALNSKDTYLCSETMPALLKYVGCIEIGHKPKVSIKLGECAYIPTGGMLPEGADAVAMIEDCEEIGEEVIINKSVSKWENVVFEDDDVKKGELLILKGTELKSKHIAMLAGLGITKVRVKRKIRAAVISTGDELILPIDEFEIPKVRDMNGFYLKEALSEDGCISTYFGIVRDNEEALYETVKKALENNDIVFLSGGSSAGNRDFTINIMESLGEVLFHGIAIKPGKPTLAAKCGNKFIIGLPGHPLSCAVVYKFVISKLIDGLYERKKREIYIEGVMGENYHKAKGREEYLPVSINNGIIYPLYAKSSAMSIMAKADGFIRIERDVEGIAKGEKVKVLR
jgi:molybdopterin molybdotransferase